MLLVSGADPGFEKRGGPKYLMYPCSVFEVGGGAGGGATSMSTLRHSYRDAVILKTKIFVS